jgi:hypothetical protein
MKKLVLNFILIAAGMALFSCSDAPQIVRSANRVVLVELFSTPLDE